MSIPWNYPPLWHAINVHLPLVLALLGVPLVLAVAVTRGRRATLRWFTAGVYLLLVGSALWAVQTGERAMDAIPNWVAQPAWDQVEHHESMAEKVWIFAAATLVMLLFAAIPAPRFRLTAVALAVVASIATGIWVTLVGHSGGVAVYQYGLGTGALKQPEIAPVATTRAIEPSTQATTEPSQPAQPVSFSSEVKPLLEAKCLECHSSDEPKGKFDASTIAGLIKGGRKAGPGVVAGKPDESSIIQYVTGVRKPRMPKGDDPLTEAQIALLRNWIASGATEDAPANTKANSQPIASDVK